MRRLRSTGGQASIEWLVVIGVVVTVFTVAGARVGTSEVAAMVVRQFDRALCIVSGGDCYEDRKPCTTGARTHIDDTSVSMAIVKFTSTTTLLVEHRSDGTYRITRTHDGGVGLEAAFGADFSLSAIGLKMAVGGEARASVLAHAARGDVWLVPAAQAQNLAKIEAYIVVGGTPPGATKVQRFSQHGTAVAVSGSLARAGATVGVSVAQDDIDGTRTDTQTGQTTTFLRRRFDSDVALAVGRSLAGISLTGLSTTDYAFTTDRSGRPIDFEILSVGRLATGGGLLGIAQRAPIKPMVRIAAGDAWEQEQHLDLTNPDNLAAVNAFMKAGDSGDLDAIGGATRALAARLAVSGVDQVRSYDLHQSTSGISGSVAVGERLGGSLKESDFDTRLIDAHVRGPDGLWTTRDDCLEAMRT